MNLNRKKLDSFPEMGRELRDRVLDILYPRRCPVCHDIVTPKGGRICAACRKKVSFLREPTCRCCGKQLVTWEEEYCYDCSRQTRSFSGGVALMNYDAVARSSITAFKYHGRQEYAAWYMEEMVRRYGDRLRSFGADAIVPVPVHISRRRKRGYNQAELLAKELSLRIGVPVRAKLLVRSRRTEAQKELNAQERRRNLEQVLQIAESAEGLERVILVDDIFTTGSTMEACSRVLRRAGVGRILPVSVCIGKN